MWQDLVLTVGSVVLLVMLLPTVFGPNKPARMTSLLTGSMLTVFVGVYLSLGLHLTAVITALTGAAWLLILAQSLRRGDTMLDCGQAKRKGSYGENRGAGRDL